MRSAITLGAAAALGLALLTPGAATAGGADFEELNPGGLPSLEEQVDINIVLVGFDEQDLGGVPGKQDLGLPDTYDPVIRYRLFYPKAPGQSEQDWRDQADLGLRYSFDYTIVMAGQGFEEALAKQLVDSAEPADPTLFQGPDYYGSQTADGVVPITRNSWIDGPETEAWLADNAKDLGVDPSSPTVFLMDASAIAPDLGNHVFVKTDTKDPDTGYNFGMVRASRKMTAWGGTPGSGTRVWFYDMSAGPEGWSGNWNVDDADLDGDDEPDYRIPPIWHYTAEAGKPLSYAHPGFEAPATLTEDLGKVVRYVAINLLFATSPLYPPFFTPNRIPDTVELDLNVVEWWNNLDVSKTFVRPDIVAASVKGLPAGPEISVSRTQDLPFSGDWSRCFQGFAQGTRLCYNDLARGVYSPFANLFLASARNQRTFLDRTADYEAALIGFGIGSKAKDPQGLLGFADDNWLNGTQSGVFSFVDPVTVSLGYGMTTTMIHEYGHHSSMSHPHDGYDSTHQLDYGPGGPTQFAWLGDMSHTIMSYLDLATDFGQFDLDNSARHHAAGYAKIANVVAADVLAQDPSADLSAVDASLVAAQAALANHQYATMLAEAKAAYDSVVAAADLRGVAVEVKQPSTWSLAGPIKPGNGSRADRANYAIDLDPAHNIKRMYAK